MYTEDEYLAIILEIGRLLDKYEDCQSSEERVVLAAAIAFWGEFLSQ